MELISISISAVSLLFVAASLYYLARQTKQLGTTLCLQAQADVESRFFELSNVVSSLSGVAVSLLR